MPLPLPIAAPSRAPASSVPRAQARGSLLALAALAVAAALLTAPPALLAQAGKAPLLKLELELEGPAGARAVAISADETILAAAVPAGDGAAVTLIDRPSGARLGVIGAAVGVPRLLRFAPGDEELLIVGSKAMQLWALPIAPLDPQKPLDRQHLRWEQPLPSGREVSAAGFAPTTGAVYWGQGRDLLRHPKSPAAAGAAEVWQGSDAAAPVTALTLSPEAGKAALLSAGAKALSLVDLDTGRASALAGHRFPVSALTYGQDGQLRSVDQGLNLLRWSTGNRPTGLKHIAQAPEGFAPSALLPAGPSHLWLLGQQGGGTLALLLAEDDAAVLEQLPLPGPEALAVSPTGRYVLLAQAEGLQLYGFGKPLSPLAYVRRLRERKAFQTAQSYVRLMEDAGLDPQVKAALLSELNRVPDTTLLSEHLARLSEAVEALDPERIAYWSEQVRALQPDHPDLLQAERLLGDLRETAVLAQAGEAYERGEDHLVISLLSAGVPQESPRYPDALELIRKAEARRGLQTVLSQARDAMNVGNFPAADALVNGVLKDYPEHQAALALQDEIADRSGVTARRYWAMGIGTALAVLIVGLLALRFREQIAPLFRRVRLDEDETLREARWPGGRPPGTGATPGGNGVSGNGVHAEARRAPPRAERTQEAPRRGAAPATRRRVVQDLLNKTEELLHFARNADVYQQHRARLMEWEAELRSLRGRMADTGVDLGPVHTRLKELNAWVRSLKFEKPAEEEPAAEAAPEPGPEADLTHYEVLRVAPNASGADIKRAYHRLIKEYHPDMHNASQFGWVKEQADRMTRRISQAYDVLRDSRSRAAYDRELRGRDPQGKGRRA